MKKVLAIVLVLAVIFCFTACGEPEEITSPIQDFKNLKSLNEATGAQLVFPEGMSVSNEVYTAVEAGDSYIAECIFTYNEIEFTYRSAAAIFDEDISGIYFDSEPAFSGTVSSDVEFNSYYRYRVARWQNINGQFSLSTTTGVQEDEFNSIVSSFVEYSNPVPTGERLVKYYEDIVGEYQDKTSERASLVATSSEEGVKFDISWASSANVTTTWELTVNLGEDGLLYYDDCTQITYEIGEYEDQTITIDEIDGSGYFEIGSKGELYWTGASNPDCVSCVFEK